MLSIVVTTCDQRDQVEPCIESILGQDADEPMEVIVVDDASTDGTAEIVRARWGNRVRLITKDARAGWLDSLRQGAHASAADAVVVFDPHCRAPAGWLKAIAREWTEDTKVLSGRCTHGRRFMEKLAALTIHGAVIGREPSPLGFFFDDNCVFRKDVLLALLAAVPSRPEFDDAIGSVLLAAAMRRRGIQARHSPACVAFHFTPAFRGYLGIWWGQAPACTMVTRRVDPTLRGGTVRRLGPLAPFLLGPGRFLQDVVTILKRHRDAEARWVDIPLLCAAAWVGKVVYFAGLFRFLFRGPRIR